MIRKLRQDIAFKKNDALFLADLKQQFSDLRKEHSVVTVFPKNTDYSWQGVKSAAISLFQNNWIELPHYYSQSLLSPKSHIELGQHIAELKFDQLIFNGFTKYFTDIAKSCKQVNSSVKTKVIYHGFLAELAKNDFQQEALQSLLDARLSGVIDTIGFVKKGLANTFNHLHGLDCKEIILFNPPKKDQQLDQSELKIGALVSNTFRKNFHNMATAAILCEKSTLHVSNASELGYLNAGNRIKEHGFLDHSDFIKLLGSMTINLHVTFSEASGGQVCSESISQGVPCISAYTSAFFDYDDEMKNRLVVDGFDDSWHIYKKIESVLDDREYLSKRCLEYSAYLNTLAEDRMNDFLGA